MADLDQKLDAFAQRLFLLALERQQCGSVLDCLFAGGSVTIDGRTGDIVLITSEQLRGMKFDD